MAKKQTEEAPAPEVVETKADKFRRLGNRRLPNAVKALDYLANLGNKRVYEYTAEQRQIVLNEVAKAAKRVADAFADTPPADNGTTLFF